MTAAVRAANPTDLDWLLLQLKAFSAFYGTKRQLIEDEDYARAKLLEMIEGDHLLLVAENDAGDRVGLIGGYVTPHWMNPRIRTLSEAFWWVDEAHRNTRAGIALLEVFITWGRQNCDWITFTLEANSPVRDETLTKRGFRLQERAYLLEVA